MTVTLVVGLAGAFGAVARYLLDGFVQDRTSGLFPIGTLSVNFAGSLVLGVVSALAIQHPVAGTTKAVIGAGFCGALTTWSTASWETVRLAEEGAASTAVAYTIVNLAGSLVAGGLGLLFVLR